jgi:hypothetical protein
MTPPDAHSTALVPMPPKIIACGALRDEVSALAGDIDAEFLEGQLHDTPDALRAALQERIDATPGARTILLAYGRCSNGTAGLKAGPHRLVLPAVDDCISILLGSRERYLREFAAHPGTYYYTRGWIEDIQDSYQVYLKLIPKYGEEKAAMLSRMELANYTRVALIDTHSYAIEKYEPYVRTVAEFYDLALARLEGSLRLMGKLLHGPHDGEFIVVEPGGELEERLFWDLAGASPHPGA